MRWLATRASEVRGEEAFKLSRLSPWDESGRPKLSLAPVGEDMMPRRAEEGGVAATTVWDDGRVLLGVALEPRELGLLPTAAGAGLLGGWLPSEFMAQIQ